MARRCCASKPMIMFAFGRAKLILLVAIGTTTVLTGVLLLKNNEHFLDVTFANDNDPLLDSANLDSDGDGLADVLEKDLGTNPYLADTDGDGYSDSEEVQAGYDPLLTESDDQLDVDGDGLTGEDERKFGTNPRLADTDFDGVPDGVEIVQGTDAGKTEIDSLPDYIGANVVEQRDESLFPAVSPDDFEQIEQISNAQTFDDFQNGLAPIVGDEMPKETDITYDSTLRPNVSDRVDEAFIQAYFNRIGLVAAKHSPVLDTNELAEFGNITNFPEPEARADFVRRLENARSDFAEIEVPNDPELVTLHTDALQMIDASYKLASQAESLNLGSPSSLQGMLDIMNRVQTLISRLESDIFPRMQAVALKHQFEIPSSFSEFLN